MVAARGFVLGFVVTFQLPNRWLSVRILYRDWKVTYSDVSVKWIRHFKMICPYKDWALRKKIHGQVFAHDS